MSVLGKHRLNLYNTTGEQVRVKGCEGCKWAVSFKITSGSRIVFLASVYLLQMWKSQRDLNIYKLATITILYYYKFWYKYSKWINTCLAKVLGQFVECVTCQWVWLVSSLIVLQARNLPHETALNLILMWKKKRLDVFVLFPPAQKLRRS